MFFFLTERKPSNLFLKHAGHNLSFFWFFFFFFGICTKNGLLLNFLGAQKGNRAPIFRYPMFDAKKPLDVNMNEKLS